MIQKARERNKAIIDLKLPPTRDFNDQMEFLQKIDKAIRTAIRKLDVPEMKRRAINRNLFPHLIAE